MTVIEREKRTISLMIGIYCRKKHKVNHKGKDLTLCNECAELLRYAHSRLERCPKGSAKKSCRKCDIHCYRPDMKQRIREVMRYVGPRMLLIHPVAAIRHLLSEI